MIANQRLVLSCIVLLALVLIGLNEPPRIATASESTRDNAGPPVELMAFFSPPPKYQGDLGKFRSPLEFAGGKPVKTVEDWQRRRAEIRETWHKLMGPWPPLLGKPQVETIKSTRRDS